MPSGGRAHVRSSLTASTFAAHVAATDPLTGDVAYEQDRVITAAGWSRRDEVTLTAEHGWGIGRSIWEWMATTKR